LNILKSVSIFKGYPNDKASEEVVSYVRSYMEENGEQARA